jgi:hypothetical protein
MCASSLEDDRREAVTQRDAHRSEGLENRIS